MVWTQLLFVIETKPWQFVLRRMRTPQAPLVNNEELKQLDEDVAHEAERVNSPTADDNYLVRVNQLRKVYKAPVGVCKANKNVVAVKRLSFGLDVGECFALLGVNGAGKSTTFKMLTNEI